MASLADELRADQDPRSQCRTCVYIASLKAADQAEWDAAIADRSYTHASIYRAITRRIEGEEPRVSLSVGRASVEAHRGAHHRKS